MSKQNLKMIEFKVKGMTCGGCEAHVKKALTSVPGVAKVCQVDWKKGLACIEVNEEVDPDSLVASVAKAGYTAEITADTLKGSSKMSSQSSKDYDLLILGSGSAAFAAAIKATELGKTVGIIEERTLGGTCVNVGCVPSKTMIRAAESKHRMEHTPFAGLVPNQARLDFRKIVQEKDNLVSELRQAKYASILEANSNITLIQGKGKFLNATTIQVGERKVTGEKILIATGSSSFTPDIPGLKESGYLTSTTALELPALPAHLVVLGGGYIALELSQMFVRMGSRVTIIQRSEILFQEDKEISESLGEYLEAEGVKILNHALVNRVNRSGKSLTIEITRRGEPITIQADELLVATGRKPNTAGLGLDVAGVSLKQNGAIQVNSFCQTTQPNIYAAGDVLDSPALVYVAAYEGNLAIENAFSGNVRQADYRTVPWVIFSDPQVAGVGLNEAQAKAQGVEYDFSLLTLDNVPRAIAARDTRGFVKLLRKTGTNELIGARVLAPEGSELIMELSLILRYKIPLDEVASMFHPYLTLSEAVKLAVQTFDKDIKNLSCCAS